MQVVILLGLPHKILMSLCFEMGGINGESRI